LDQHTELKKLAEGKIILFLLNIIEIFILCVMVITAKKESEMEKQLKEEEKILESVAEKKALMGVAELAKGIQYDNPIKTR